MPQSFATKNKYGQAFIYAFLMSLFLFLPVMIYSKGLLIYSDEFNENVLASLCHLSGAVSDGLMSFDALSGKTALSLIFENGIFGGLTAFIPKSIAVYIIPFVICLKFGLSSLAAYSYISQFIKNSYASLAGAIIYAFSGFGLYALNYGSFIDIMIFFPLLMIAAEKTFFHGKHGIYALCLFAVLITESTLLSAVLIFIAVYLCVRYMKGNISVSHGGVFGIVSETIIAAMMAGIVLVPSLKDYFTNNSFFFGCDILAFSEPSHIWQILSSALLPSEIPDENSLFSPDTFRYSLYLPVFGISGAVSFLYCQQKHWSSKILTVLMAFLFVPLLNCLMSFMNTSYSADWLFILMLILSLMTAYAIDDANTSLSAGIKFSAFMLSLILIYAIIPADKDSKILSSSENPVYFGALWSVSMLGLLFVRYISALKRSSKPFFKNLILITVSLSIVSAMPVIYYTVYNFENRDNIKKAISAEFDFESEDFFRIALPDEFEKTGVFLGYPYVTFSEYSESPDIYAVKYFILPKGDTPDFESADYKYTENGFDIYENSLFNPIGTAFPVSDDNSLDMSSEISTVISSSSYENGNLSLEISLLKEGGVMFSLPYSEGFSATVNGNSAEIFPLPNGFFFVKAVSGSNDILITYEMPISYEYYISLAGIILYLIYIVACIAFRMTDNIDDEKKKKKVSVEDKGLTDENSSN